MFLKKIKRLSVRDFFRYFFAIPNTLYFNFHYFPFKLAMRLPVIVSAKTKFANMGGKVILNCDKPETGMVRIGLGYVGIFDYEYSRTIWENSGTVVFSGGGKCRPWM